MPDRLPIPTVRWVLFGFGGRIGRQSFILGQLFMMALGGVVIARIVAVRDDETQLALWGLALISLVLIAACSMFALTIKRLHDLGFPGALSILLFVPTVNLVMLMLLMVVPSSSETNRHGPPPFGPTGKSAKPGPDRAGAGDRRGPIG